MTLLFVLRDTTESPIKVLADDLWNDIQQIWNSFDKPDHHKGTPLDEFFNVWIVGLPHYQHQKYQFKEEVAILRQRFFNSIALGKFAGDGIVPASVFSDTIKKLWKDIRKNKDLDLPSLKIMVATVRCEQIANEKFDSIVANEDWLKLHEDVQSHPVPQFGKKLSSILDSCLLE